MHRLHPLAPVVLVSVLSACGPHPIEPGPDTGPVTAYVDGDAFIADSARVTRSGNAGVEVAVRAWGSGGRSIAFEFIGTVPANYLIGPGNEVSGSVTIGTSTWTAEGANGEGTITVTALLPTRLEGSFVLTVVGGGSPSSLDVTDGRFLIDYF